MDIRGYEVGPIEAEAAFSSDFPVAAEVDMRTLVNMQELERRVMDARPGMLMKYMPAKYDEATGRAVTGGRYLFDTWENVREYARFTSEELEFEPGVKFWSRPAFLNVDRHLWRVAGAHNFTPLAEHAVDRFERFTYESGEEAEVAEALAKAWPAIRDEAERLGLGAAWLLHQPEERQIAIHTIGGRAEAADPAEAGTLSMAGLASAASLGTLLPAALIPTRVFDRTSMIVSMWLPKSRQAGGVPTANPMTPPLPAWTVEPQRV